MCSGSDMSYGEYGCLPSNLLCDPDDDIHYKLSESDCESEWKGMETRAGAETEEYMIISQVL